MIDSSIENFLPVGRLIEFIMFDARFLYLIHLMFLGGVHYNRYIDSCQEDGWID